MHENLYSYFCVQSSKYTIHVKVYFKYFSNTFRGNIDPSPKIFFPGSFFSRQLKCYDLEFRIKDPLTEIYEAETFAILCKNKLKLSQLFFSILASI